MSINEHKTYNNNVNNYCNNKNVRRRRVRNTWQRQTNRWRPTIETLNATPGAVRGTTADSRPPRATSRSAIQIPTSGVRRSISLQRNTLLITHAYCCHVDQPIDQHWPHVSCNFSLSHRSSKTKNTNEI